MRHLPSDLFRTCLARVLMVLFDILVSHFHMVRPCCCLPAPLFLTVFRPWTVLQQ